jgi:hypothetical protein
MERSLRSLFPLEIICASLQRGWFIPVFRVIAALSVRTDQAQRSRDASSTKASNAGEGVALLYGTQKGAAEGHTDRIRNRRLKGRFGIKQDKDPILIPTRPFRGREPANGFHFNRFDAAVASAGWIHPLRHQRFSAESR